MTRRIAAITGGAGHIGRAIGSKLAARDVDILVLDKDRGAGQNWAADLLRQHGGDHRFLEIDLLDKSVFTQVHDDILTKNGKLDYLVNNAAFYDDIPGWGVPFEQEGYEAWMKVMQVNLLAPFFLTQSLHPLFRKSDDASVVNIGTMYTVVGPNHKLYAGTEMTNPAAYTASKAGLIGVTRWLSTVLAPGVRVNAISPGGIARGQNSTFVEKYNNLTPLGRMGTEQDIVGMVDLLLSPAGAYITGQHMLIDGGWTAW